MQSCGLKSVMNCFNIKTHHIHTEIKYDNKEGDLLRYGDSLRMVVDIIEEVTLEGVTLHAQWCTGHSRFSFFSTLQKCGN